MRFLGHKNQREWHLYLSRAALLLAPWTFRVLLMVEEAGTDAETGAHLYRTTGYFLERIGITGLDELPELAPYLPELDDMEEELSALVAPAPSVQPDSTTSTASTTDDTSTEEPA